MTRPSRVRVYEVGPRDGLQNEVEALNLSDKLNFTRHLLSAGFRDIEVGAFVRADRVPQMAGSAELIERLADVEQVALWALVPNAKGLERAVAAGVKHMAVFTAASEAFNRANVGMGLDESLERFKPLVADAKQQGLAVRGYLSTAWWCPYAGRVDRDVVLRMSEALVDLGCDELSIADTVGHATPGEVEATLARLTDAVALSKLGVHFHDTRGTALANVMVALDLGIATIDASAGGLGGCPFAPGALGNLATEDLVFMLHGMGIDTGVDLEKLRFAAQWIQKRLGRTLPSRYLNAGPLVARGK